MNELFRNLFIFEMANNHQGSLEHGLKIIKAMGSIARKHGIRAGVKFQYRDLDSFIHPHFQNRKDVPHVPRFLETRLSDDEFMALVRAVREERMVTICTPFDERSVERVVAHDIEIIKVGSSSANDWPLLEAIAKTDKPVICSTGGKSIYEIDNIVSFFSHRHVDFALMHCVSLYPARSEDVQLNFMERMIRRYHRIPIGYSGHEAPDNLDVVKLAVAKGAVVLERHVGLETDKIKLNAYSMNPQHAESWVAAALCARRVCGEDHRDKYIPPVEIESLLALGRGTYARRSIRKGEAMGLEDVFFAMPCGPGQTTSGEFRETMIATKDYQPYGAITEDRSSDMMNIVRSMIHEARGMLYEAQIEIGRDFTIELSHHYGLERFRQFGALIVNVINREYCKKLIVMLSGQQHPNHSHKIKEETFQLLWGELEVNLNGKRVLMKPGNKLLIERGGWHSFTSRIGAIHEEISTTHINGDSYYEDTSINRKDPIERKTIIEDW